MAKCHGNVIGLIAVLFPGELSMRDEHFSIISSTAFAYKRRF